MSTEVIHIDFPSINRLFLIKSIIEKIKAKSYLEIGCKDDYVFSKIDLETKVGVDPHSGGTLKTTSDNFFKLNRQKFDVIFIDGDHSYGQVKRDVYNSINCLNKNGIIILHDLLPTSRKDTVQTNHGDAWRISFDLMKEKNLLYKIVKVDWGCGVILPGSQNIKKLKKIKYNTWDDYVKHFNRLPIITYENFEDILIELYK